MATLIFINLISRLIPESRQKGVFDRFSHRHYVDDIILIGDDYEELARLTRKLAEEFEIKDLGAFKYFLQMEFAR